ncbi:hypothetical protein DLAC_11544 [Tieghemostelium lacteum]|uniref:Uncharacterized protein n=1 Tax=Tieghemostelium lacteum TaxID=361077 RepID=A0A152A1F9_TIELA|nr:hypothetical protein DLAC_11544 [Tieghemostelium lacteum]|eukprot:KYR00082.1 hypothetical protein DLAC_11544 [Tieghemostelium lacteum]
MSLPHHVVINIINHYTNLNNIFNIIKIVRLVCRDWKENIVKKITIPTNSIPYDVIKWLNYIGLSDFTVNLNSRYIDEVKNHGIKYNIGTMKVYVEDIDKLSILSKTKIDILNISPCNTQKLIEVFKELDLKNNLIGRIELCVTSFDSIFSIEKIFEEISQLMESQPTLKKTLKKLSIESRFNNSAITSNSILSIDLSPLKSVEHLVIEIPKPNILVSQMLSQIASLKTLILQSCPFEVIDICNLFKCLEKNNTVQMLFIGGFPAMSTDEIQSLVSMLNKNKTLLQLNFPTRETIQDQSLPMSCIVNTTIKELIFGVYSPLRCLLWRWGEKSNLELIDKVNCNQLDQIMDKHPRLTSLVVDNVDPRVYHYLSTFIKINSKTLTEMTINIESQKISLGLSNDLLLNRHLVKLDVNVWSFTELIQLLDSNHVSVRDVQCSIWEFDCKQFSESLCRNRTLTHIGLFIKRKSRKRESQQTFIESLIDILSRNEVLTSLSINAPNSKSAAINQNQLTRYTDALYNNNQITSLNIQCRFLYSTTPTTLETILDRTYHYLETQDKIIYP